MNKYYNVSVTFTRYLDFKDGDFWEEIIRMRGGDPSRKFLDIHTHNWKVRGDSPEDSVANLTEYLVKHFQSIGTVVDQMICPCTFCFVYEDGGFVNLSIGEASFYGEFEKNSLALFID